MAKMFYQCGICGNIVELIHSGGGVPSCCGQPMKKLEANSKDAALEKHVPVASLNGTVLDVQVGDVLHPMTPEHYIQWITVTQGDKTQRVELSPDCEPKATFTLDSATEPFSVYEYCNLHGLWMK